MQIWTLFYLQTDFVDNQVTFSNAIIIVRIFIAFIALNDHKSYIKRFLE